LGKIGLYATCPELSSPWYHVDCYFSKKVLISIDRNTEKKLRFTSAQLKGKGGRCLLAASTSRADVVQQLHILPNVDLDPVGQETFSKIRIRIWIPKKYSVSGKLWTKMKMK
jgi:hypothetical protein